jgi:hypothetical protein
MERRTTRAVKSISRAAGRTPSTHLIRRRDPQEGEAGGEDTAHGVHEGQSRQGRVSIVLINEP